MLGRGGNRISWIPECQTPCQPPSIPEPIEEEEEHMPRTWGDRLEATRTRCRRLLEAVSGCTKTCSRCDQKPRGSRTDGDPRTPGPPRPPPLASHLHAVRLELHASRAARRGSSRAGKGRAAFVQTPRSPIGRAPLSFPLPLRACPAGPSRGLPGRSAKRGSCRPSRAAPCMGSRSPIAAQWPQRAPQRDGRGSVPAPRERPGPGGRSGGRANNGVRARPPPGVTYLRRPPSSPAGCPRTRAGRPRTRPWGPGGRRGRRRLPAGLPLPLCRAPTLRAPPQAPPARARARSSGSAPPGPGWPIPGLPGSRRPRRPPLPPPPSARPALPEAAVGVASRRLAAADSGAGAERRRCGRGLAAIGRRGARGGAGYEWAWLRADWPARGRGVATGRGPGG